MRSFLTFMFAISMVFGTALFGAPKQEGVRVEGKPEGNVQGQMQSSEEGDWSDKELKQFAVAYTKIVKIRKDVGPQLETMSKGQKKDDLKKEAEKNMQQAAESTGLSLRDFRSIMDELNQDPQLRKRFKALMKESK